MPSDRFPFERPVEAAEERQRWRLGTHVVIEPARARRARNMAGTPRVLGILLFADQPLPSDLRYAPW